jgi:CrcB protein
MAPGTGGARIVSLTLLWVAAGGAMGALTRFGIGEWVRVRTRWPGWVAVFAANLIGTSLLALVHFTIGQSDVVSPSVQALVALGYCGALTTYSAFGLDTVLLWYEGQRGIAVAQFGATLACGALLIQLIARALSEAS